MSRHDTYAFALTDPYDTVSGKYSLEDSGNTTTFIVRPKVGGTFAFEAPDSAPSSGSLNPLGSSLKEANISPTVQLVSC